MHRLQGIYKFPYSVNTDLLFCAFSFTFILGKDKIVKKMVGIRVILHVIWKLRGTVVASIVGVT